MESLRQLALAFDLPAYRWTAWGALYAVAVAAVLLVGLLVLSGRGSRASLQVRRAFMLDMVCIAASLAGIAGTMTAATPEQSIAATRVGLIPGIMVGPATLHFCAVLAGWRGQLRGFRWAAALSGGLLSAIGLLTPYMVEDTWRTPYGFAAHAGPLMPSVIVHLSACMAGAMAVVIGAWRQAREVRVRRQMRAVLIAYAIGNLTMLDLLPLWGFVVTPSAWLWVTITAVILAFSIREHQLLDAPDFGWRALMWALTSALVAAPVLLALWLLRDWRGWGHALSTSVVLFGLFTIVRIYQLRLQPRIDDVFQRRRRDMQRELEQLGETLLVLRTAESIADEVARLLHRGLYARLTCFAVREDDRWRVVHSAWGTLRPPGDDEPLLVQMARDPRPLLREPRGADRLFERYGAEVLVPVPAPGGELSGTLQALVAIGPRWDGRPFEPYELAFLGRLPAIVAPPLGAARLYDKRHRLREELEEKVAAKSADLARAIANLQSAQHQLVQGEKMATLGLVVGGVSAELKAAVDEALARVPAMQAAAVALDEAAESAIAALPPGKPGDDVRAWIERSGFDFQRRELDGVVDAIVEGTRRAASIAEDLSRFARADGAVPEPVDLSRELEGTLNLLRHVFKDRVEVVRHYGRDLPPVVCERGPIGQVFMNLLMNSAQAIEGRGTITVRTTLVDEGHGVVVSVRDTGKGISADHLSRIFEPFFTTKPLLGGGGGSGLGLSISYGIVQRHGGKILVDSTVGQGTEMRVILPVGGPARLRAS